MTFRLGGLFLTLCAIATATATPEPEFSLFDTGSDTVDTYCKATEYLIRWFPLDFPEVEKVSFELRTPCKRTNYPVTETINLRNAPEFDANKKTVVFVSGWNSDMDDEYYKELSKAVLCRGETNYIVVNTHTFLQTEYANSAYNTLKLGEFVALGLKNLNIPATDIHLVGHSLGAQVMGTAARQYAALTGNKIARVTGLDPAKPCFSDSPVFSRLSPSDATFVDVVHSNPDESGTEDPVGHLDFFPNGLKPTQPGCSILDLVCSHMRSIEYFTETVYPGNENNFMATPCESYEKLEDKQCAGAPQVAMGYAVNKENKGIYFLSVNPQSPFGKNAANAEYLLKLEKCGVCPN